MKPTIFLLICAMSVGSVYAQVKPDYVPCAELNIHLDGEPLSSKNKEKLEQMSAYMSEFYSSLGLNECLEVRLVIFKSKEEGYEIGRASCRERVS